MCKECFHCYYGHGLTLKTNTVDCEQFNKAMPNDTAEECEDFIPEESLGTEDIEVITEYYIHHKCPHCGVEDTIYDADAEGDEIIECENCGKKYAVNWCLY